MFRKIKHIAEKFPMIIVILTINSTEYSLLKLNYRNYWCAIILPLQRKSTKQGTHILQINNRSSVWQYQAIRKFSKLKIEENS